MASLVLFPPIIDSYMPAFQATPKDAETAEKPCRIYFSLSNFNSSKDFKNVQAVVKYQDNNLDAVNTRDKESNPEMEDDTGHYRQTGIILDLEVHEDPDEPNLYYFDLYNIDMNGNREEDSSKDNTSSYLGWKPGFIYKIQIRLSDIWYRDSIGSQSQQEWLNDVYHNRDFSEWSTICVLKVIGKVDVEIPILEFDSQVDDPEYTHKTLYLSTLDLKGKFTSEDKGERLYSFRVKIYQGTDATEYTPILDDSGTLYTNQFQDVNEFKYLSKLNLDNGETYTVVIDFVTNNDYSFSVKIIFTASHARVDDARCQINYLYSDVNLLTSKGVEEMFKNISTLDEEEEEGRIALKVTAKNKSNIPYYGSFYIRRSSSKDDFKNWEDVFLITLKGTPLESLDVIYDYTIESGVFYKYGIQSVDVLGVRGILEVNQTATMRNFNFSYLLGQNNQQLKLMFDNTMNNYKIQVSESKSETIGHRYPKVARNNAVYYRVFPVNGLISYLMDPNNLFCTDEDMYGDQADLYKDYNKALKALSVDRDYNGLIETGGSRTLIDYNSGLPILDDEGKPVQVSPSVDIIFDRNVTLRENLGEYPVNYGVSSEEQLKSKHFPQYDYIHEKDFREMVLKFIYDGQPKLFKSPTEGNVIVRLMDINCTPVQPLSRMLYSFTSNGNEIAENTVDNYRKYKFLDVQAPSSDLYTAKTKIGQLHMDFTVGAEGNIIDEIYNKHNRVLNNYGGYQAEVIKIHHLRITIDQKPFRINISDGAPEPTYMLGNQFVMTKKLLASPKTFTIYNTMQMYEFDERLSFDDKDVIYFLGDADGAETTVKATIDYLYDVIEQPYVERIVTSRHFVSIPGQFYGACVTGQDIFQEIEKKYYYNWSNEYRKINTISSVEIEAAPNSVFEIRDAGDEELEGAIITHVINESGILNLHNLSNINGITYKGWYEKNGNETESGANTYVRQIAPANIPLQNVIVNYICTLETGAYQE